MSNEYFNKVENPEYVLAEIREYIPDEYTVACATFGNDVEIRGLLSSTLIKNIHMNMDYVVIEKLIHYEEFNKLICVYKTFHAGDISHVVDLMTDESLGDFPGTFLAIRFLDADTFILLQRGNNNLLQIYTNEILTFELNGRQPTKSVLLTNSIVSYYGSGASRIEVRDLGGNILIAGNLNSPITDILVTSDCERVFLTVINTSNIPTEPRTLIPAINLNTLQQDFLYSADANVSIVKIFRISISTNVYNNVVIYHNGNVDKLGYYMKVAREDNIHINRGVYSRIPTIEDLKAYPNKVSMSKDNKLLVANGITVDVWNLNGIKINTIICGNMIDCIASFGLMNTSLSILTDVLYIDMERLNAFVNILNVLDIPEKYKDLLQDPDSQAFYKNVFYRKDENFVKMGETTLEKIAYDSEKTKIIFEGQNLRNLEMFVAVTEQILDSAFGIGVGYGVIFTAIEKSS